MVWIFSELQSRLCYHTSDGFLSPAEMGRERQKWARCWDEKGQVKVLSNWPSDLHMAIRYHTLRTPCFSLPRL